MRGRSARREPRPLPPECRAQTWAWRGSAPLGNELVTRRLAGIRASAEDIVIITALDREALGGSRSICHGSRKWQSSSTRCMWHLPGWWCPLDDFPQARIARCGPRTTSNAHSTVSGTQSWWMRSATTDESRALADWGSRRGRNDDRPRHPRALLRRSRDTRTLPGRQSRGRTERRGTDGQPVRPAASMRAPGCALSRSGLSGSKHAASAEPLTDGLIELEARTAARDRPGPHSTLTATSALYVPSTGPVAAGDAVYGEVHLYLAEAKGKRRAAGEWPRRAGRPSFRLNPSAVSRLPQARRRCRQPGVHVGRTRRHIEDFTAAAEQAGSLTDLYRGNDRSLPADRVNRAAPPALRASLPRSMD